MTEPNKTLIGFREHLGGFFHDFFKAAGIAIASGTASSRIREIGERMAKAIESAAEIKSIEVIRRLQKVIAESFEKVEDELNKLSKISASHNELIGGLLIEQKRLAERLDKLEKDKKNNEDPTIRPC